MKGWKPALHDEDGVPWGYTHKAPRYRARLERVAEKGRLRWRAFVYYEPGPDETGFAWGASFRYKENAARWASGAVKLHRDLLQFDAEESAAIGGFCEG